MMTDVQLAAMQAEVFEGMGMRALERFAAFLRGKAEAAAYACSQIGAPEDFRRDCLATIRFCHGFADKAEEALAAQKAAATAKGAGGFQT